MLKPEADVPSTPKTLEEQGWTSLPCEEDFL